jgi:hypothetical protein
VQIVYLGWDGREGRGSKARKRKKAIKVCYQVSYCCKHCTKKKIPWKF